MSLTSYQTAPPRVIMHKRREAACTLQPVCNVYIVAHRVFVKPSLREVANWVPCVQRNSQALYVAKTKGETFTKTMQSAPAQEGKREAATGHLGLVQAIHAPSRNVSPIRTGEDEERSCRRLPWPAKVIHTKCVVRPRRLELPRGFPHSDLNAARLPIPPRPHMPASLIWMREGVYQEAGKDARG